MAPDALEIARSRYTTAYHAYKLVADRVVEKLSNGSPPSGEDVELEGKELERLVAARRELLDLLARVSGR